MITLVTTPGWFTSPRPKTRMLLAAAEAAATSLSLPLEVRLTGFGDLSRHLEEQVIRTLSENEVTHAAH